MLLGISPELILDSTARSVSHPPQCLHMQAKPPKLHKNKFGSRFRAKLGQAGEGLAKAGCTRATSAACTLLQGVLTHMTSPHIVF